MNNIFITTSSGNIGTELVKQLQQMGLAFSAGYNQNKPIDLDNLKPINFDDYNSLVSAFAGHQTLFLLLPDNEKAVEWAKTAIKAGIESGIKHIVRSSGINADSNSNFLVFKTLGEIENLVKQSGLDYTFVRPNSFFQNFVTYHSFSLKAGGLYLPQGNGKVSYVDVRDVALTVATILKNPKNHIGKIYTLTGNVAYHSNEIVNLISEAIDKTLTYVSIPDADYIETMQKYHLPQFNIDTLLSLYQADKENHNSIITNDIENVTSIKPISFESFIKDNADRLK
jgi:NAD(P)H dehydrogenase (quinone)